MALTIAFTGMLVVFWLWSMDELFGRPTNRRVVFVMEACFFGAYMTMVGAILWLVWF